MSSQTATYKSCVRTAEPEPGLLNLELKFGLIQLQPFRIVAAMGNLRERHNAKARKSRPGKRPKHSHNSGDVDTQTTIDPNADIVTQKSKEQREADRRERLRQEVSLG